MIGLREEVQRLRAELAQKDATLQAQNNLLAKLLAAHKGPEQLPVAVCVKSEPPSAGPQLQS